MIHKAAKAARAIAAHLGFAAVGVVVTHFEVATVGGWFHTEQTIGSDAAMAVAELFDLVLGQREAEIAIVQHDEVIAGAVHFGELKSHGSKSGQEVKEGRGRHRPAV